MITTIISNNCMGGVICSRNHMQFKSPTVALQILPEEYLKFCVNLKHYMECDVEEYTDISDEHKEYLEKMYGFIPTNFPYGIVDDIMICFQHYQTFEQARDKWNIRKKRIEWNNIAYLFHAKGIEYIREVDKFLTFAPSNSIALTEGFEIGRSYRFDVPDVPGIDAFGWWNGKFSIEYGKYNEKEWLGL